MGAFSKAFLSARYWLMEVEVKEVKEESEWCGGNSELHEAAVFGLHQALRQDNDDVAGVPGSGADCLLFPVRYHCQNKGNRQTWHLHHACEN